MQIDKSQISGLILAGGRGRRVGERDKGLIAHKDKRLIEHQVLWLSRQLDSIFISANRNHKDYLSFGYPVISDGDIECYIDNAHSDFAGPLTGVLSGFANSQNEWLFVLPVDQPDLPANLIQIMTDYIHRNELNNYVYCMETESREHYLPLLINRKCLAALIDFITHGKAKISEFLSLLNTGIFNPDLNESHFTNLNNIDDFVDLD
ncbi:MAG: molybdenum cofactor guanylyltransferase [Gammaproteobacteria bacterium]|nr:molybdenum cofactor guanylyltransferase [Gammaproteobacteria bacterium]MDH5628572.1 molybdenum cofactor guanylyltransferase [Gammaproteobacteria bacterium]